MNRFHINDRLLECGAVVPTKQQDYGEIRHYSSRAEHKWYDMIESGEKPEEYRRCTPYWIKRLLGCNMLRVMPARLSQRVRLPIKKGTTVTFHRGYTNITMSFDIEYLAWGHGLPQWGAPKETCFIIRLGRRLDDEQH